MMQRASGGGRKAVVTHPAAQSSRETAHQSAIQNRTGCRRLDAAMRPQRLFHVTNMSKIVTCDVVSGKARTCRKERQKAPNSVATPALSLSRELFFK